MRDVDLDVAHGERRAILGPNGAGKTTLFNVISGDVPPTSGTIEFLGQDVTLLPPRAAREARHGPHVPEVPSRSSASRSRTTSTSRCSACRAGHLRPGRPAQARRRAARARARAGCEPSASTAREQTLVGSLSHGEQRQLEVGDGARRRTRSLMMLDEPASGLSRGERVALTELLLAARPGDHADPDRARHGRRAARRRPGDDDARRPRDRRRHARRDPREPDRARPLPRPRVSARMADAAARDRGRRRVLRHARGRSRTFVRDRRRLDLDRRPERHGQDDAVQRDHRHPAGAGHAARSASRARELVGARRTGSRSSASGTCRRAAGCSRRSPSTSTCG